MYFRQSKECGSERRKVFLFKELKQSINGRKKTNVFVHVKLLKGFINIVLHFL